MSADLGAGLAADFVNRSREDVMYGTVTRADQLRPLLRRFLVDTLGEAKPLALDAHPSVILMLGVNGSGKTDHVRQARHRAQGRGSPGRAGRRRHPADAAIEQLETWERVGSTSRSVPPGSDPAAVASTRSRLRWPAAPTP